MMDLVPPLFLVYLYIMTLRMTSDQHESTRSVYNNLITSTSNSLGMNR
jgi:hypothetical protein